MVQRSKIRQSALQFIYASLQSGEASIARDLFWGIAQEKQRSHYINAFVKAILHSARSSVKSFDALSEHVSRITRALEGDMVTITLRETLERYYAASQRMEASIASLQLMHTDKRFDSDDELLDEALNIVQQATVCFAFAGEYSQATLDFPAYEDEFLPFVAVLKTRGRLEQGLQAFSDIKALPAEGEFRGLVQSFLDLEELRPAVEEMALPALDRQAEWDKLISPLLKRYSLDRLDVLDRSILYLSLYELKGAQLPLPIVISEATALANTYSGSKSAPFIHGVLAAAAVAPEPQDEPEEEVEQLEPLEIMQEQPQIVLDDEPTE